MSDVLLVLLRINLAAAAAIAVVLALRLPTRRLFGSGVAYALWLLAPLAALAMVLPARVVTVAREPSSGDATMLWSSVVAAAPQPGVQAGLDWPPLLASLWIAGAALSLLCLAWQQVRFGRTVRAGRGGPAVIGVLKPRIVTPADFDRRYTPREQMVVLAHERTHIARHDSRINGLVAFARCVSWFNPFVHLLAHYLRIDQELACDAAVVAAHPTARRAYAEALLKTQLAGRPLPLGCYWPAQAAHPLAQRIGLLADPTPRGGARLGAALVALLASGAVWTCWAARPAEVVLAPTAAETHTPAAIATAPEPPAAPMPPRPAEWPPAPPRIPVTQLAVDAGDPTPAPPSADRAVPDARPRLLPPGFFGPARRIHAVADWSSVEPGSAVRVLATMTDPDGIPLTTDLTAFGSQSWYRLGYVRRNASHYKLFTSVVQHGDRLRVTAGLNRSFQPMVSGSIELGSGETGTIRLPNGLTVTVTPTLRAETPDEIADARRPPAGHLFVSVERIEHL